MINPKIRPRLYEVEVVVLVLVLVPVDVVELDELVEVTPLVTTLDEVTMKPPKELLLLIALAKDEDAEEAAEVEEDEPPVGSALPSTATELWRIEIIVM